MARSIGCLAFCLVALLAAHPPVLHRYESVEPYMGMAAHVAVASRDGAVFAHLHPAGSISMAAQDKLSGAVAAAAHTGHEMPLEGAVAIPYAFPRPGPYRLWIQIKRGGQVMTAAYDATVAAP